MPSPSSETSGVSAVVNRVAAEFASLPQVEAVALAGSRASELADAESDVDLYVYVTGDIPLDERVRIAASSSRAEIGNNTWEPGDEWIDAATGTAVDVMYRHVGWIEGQLDRVLVAHQASAGYSTCLWYNVLHSYALFDRSGWFAELRRMAGQPYPPELRRAIIAKNYPLLRRNQSSYLHQIELAIKRGDPVSVNHRVAALVASYFDVLFALNQLPHPGEKRIVQYAISSCRRYPPHMEKDVAGLVTSVGQCDSEIVAKVKVLVDGLDNLLSGDRHMP